MSGGYFPTIFAVSGDQSIVPQSGSSSGVVNFTYGYGFNYSASLNTDPAALQIDRPSFNYLMYSITQSLQYVYQDGVAPFISSAMNGGSPYSYSSGPLVFFTDNNLYYSLVASNTATPGTDPSKWYLFNPSWLANKGLIPLSNVTGGTYNFATQGSGCTLTYTVSGGVINAVTAIAAGGTSYAVGDLITPNGGNYDAVIRVTGVSGGAITSVSILYGGTTFTAGTAVATQKAKSKRQKILLSGVLASNATFILPSGSYLTDASHWIVANNTTGNFTVTFKVSNGSGGSTGTGVVITQGSNDSTSCIINTDGSTDVWFATRPSSISSVVLTTSPTSTQSNTCYYANSASLITIPMPTNPQNDDVFQIIGVGIGGWQTSQVTGQQVILGNQRTTSGAGGSLASSDKNDNITMKFNSSLGLWFATSVIGNITGV